MRITGTAEIADKAIAILKEHGWCRGYLRDEFGMAGKPGAFCVAGAVNMAATGSWHWQLPDLLGVYDQLAEILTAMHPEVREPGEHRERYGLGNLSSNPTTVVVAINNSFATEDDIIAALEKLRASAA